MRRKCILAVVLLCTLTAHGQKFVVEKSSVSFFSKATIEDITAANQSAASIFIVETGEVAFSISVKDFKFVKSLMQEHFNEKYMETEKFPKATFQGKISGYDMTGSGPQVAKAAGKLTLHGVTKEIEAPGTIEISKNKIMMKSKFLVKLEDYSIALPRLMWQNIAEQVEVSIDFTFKPYENK